MGVLLEASGLRNSYMIFFIQIGQKMTDHMQIFGHTCQNLIDFGPYIGQISIFLNGTYFIWKVSLDYIFFFIALYLLKCGNWGEKTTKNEQNCMYLGSRYSNYNLNKIEITQSVFCFQIFGIDSELNFNLILVADFWFRPPKNLAAKFQNLPGKIQNLAASYK